MKQISFYELKCFVSWYDDLKKIQRKLNKIDCDMCNGNIDEAKYKKKTAKLIDRAEHLVKGYDLKAYHQTDPRGCSLYIITEDMNDTNYTNGIACC